ncbi:MAG: hypothetical protein CL450_07460 [Acidimicrobiaceae bacterium]|nr:hypothetical protein [Acidimicrobiaceae bacterium]|tara:strand:+ start:2142 stop:2918 length:777 start_codon:yes stop_codon:yes gene_type:complete
MRLKFEIATQRNNNIMELTQHFGDGQSTYHFFKDKGGKHNHMKLSVKTKKKFSMRLVFEGGLEIPREELLLKGVALLQMVVNGVAEQYVNESGEEVLSKRVFGGDTEIAFRIMHVSRRHLDRNFQLQFIGVKGDVLQQTVLICVRSKLKTYQTYPENSSGPSGAPSGTKRKRAATREREVHKRGTTQSQKKAKKSPVDIDCDFVHVDMFNQLLGHCVRMSRQLDYTATMLANLSDRLDTLHTLHRVELLDPRLVDGLL